MGMSSGRQQHSSWARCLLIVASLCAYTSAECFAHLCAFAPARLSPVATKRPRFLGGSCPSARQKIEGSILAAAADEAENEENSQTQDLVGDLVASLGVAPGDDVLSSSPSSSPSEPAAKGAEPVQTDKESSQKLYGVTLDLPTTYVRCGNCGAVFAIEASDLGSRGKGRRLQCSVCDHTWYQSRDRLVTLQGGSEFVPFSEKDFARIKANVEAGRRPNFVGESRLYVGNLDFRCTEDDLRELFETKGGEVGEAIIVADDTGRSRGFGFVTMMTKKDGQDALELDGQELLGRNISVRVRTG